ncbi:MULTISPECIES: DMT family transporter [unclassified Bradyrhizobium]|uniref:DMT family transporter n=1 Tax=unclassified Bradyrhizobium TaxID=2631580 RepID=UPI002916D2DC|nr:MULTISPECIES: DMT family transporter [unclassified Bradyrhizobium]
MTVGVEVAGLGTAACLAISSLIAADVSRTTGVFEFTKTRMIFASFFMLPVLLIADVPLRVSVADALTLAASSLIGIVIGDLSLIAAISKIGPKKTSIIFSSNVVIGAVLEAAIYHKRTTIEAGVGILLVLTGALIVIAFRGGAGAPLNGHLNAERQNTGVALAVLAAGCQAIGTLISTPVVTAGTSPIMATTIRFCAASLLFVIMGRTRSDDIRTDASSATVYAKIVVSALVGMCGGLTLLMLAITSGKIAISMTYASSTPLVLLLLLWLTRGERPNASSLLGAITTVAGTALLIFEGAHQR